MAKKQSDLQNLHYLHDVKPSADKGQPGVEILIQDLSKRLSSLEKEIQKGLNKIQKDFEIKKPQDSKGKQVLNKEIADLKTEFDFQINEIGQTLAKSLKLKGESKEKNKKGLMDRIIGLIPFSKFLSRDGAAKEVQKILNEDIDPFGRDPAFEEKVKPIFNFLYHRYWRISTHGLENVPSKGRALLVCNHSGTLAYDGTMVRMAVSLDHPSQRDVRFLVEDFVYYLPFIGSYMYRLGGVRASPDNAEQLLKLNHLVAVFPEGVKGIGKYYSQRYHLQRFGRGGFIKLAIRTGSPIIPVAIIGAEEIHPIIYKSSLLAKPLGIPYVPFTPTLPLLGPLGLIPLPSKWSIHFGKPIHLKRYGKKALSDELQIHKLSEMVRQTIQKMVTEALKKRQSVWFG